MFQVNGEDMTTKTHQEAVSYLRQTPATVTLRFSRIDEWEDSEADSFLDSHPKKVRVHVLFHSVSTLCVFPLFFARRGFSFSCVLNP